MALAAGALRVQEAGVPAQVELAALQVQVAALEAAAPPVPRVPGAQVGMVEIEARTYQRRSDWSR